MANDIVLGYPNMTTTTTTTTTLLANLSSTTNIPEANNDEHSKLTIGILATLYTLIFIIGITGNSLVVYVVCMKKSMQTVTNLFIMNLALSDILMCLLAVPFTPISFFQEDWQLGKFLCHLVPFSLGVSVYVSTLTSLAIAIDRYFVIVHPYKPRMKLGVCCLLIAVVWIVSISISLPLAIYMELHPINNKHGQLILKCNDSWPIPMSKRFFNLASLVLQYLIPFVVITYSYTKVWIMLSNRNRPGSNMGAKRINEEIDVRRKKRTNRMLVAMVIIFAGCWMPLNCVHLTMEFNTDFTKKTYFSNVFFIAHVIAMSSTIYNPFLYAWLNVNFRKEFRLILPWLFKLLKWCARENPNDQANKTVEENYEEAGEENGMLDETMGGGGGGGHNFLMSRIEPSKFGNGGGVIGRSDSIRGRGNGLRGSRKGTNAGVVGNSNNNKPVNRSGSLKDNKQMPKQLNNQAANNHSSNKQLSKNVVEVDATANTETTPLNPDANNPNQTIA